MARCLPRRRPCEPSPCSCSASWRGAVAGAPRRTPNPRTARASSRRRSPASPSDQLSPGLRRDIDELAGRPLARPDVTQLARRIEEERPDVVVAVRIVARPGDEARVIFLVARISDDAGLGSNINARYTVESVEIEGLKEHEISAALRDRLQALVGTRLDPAEADQLIEDLKAERPGYDVARRIERGTRRGRIRVVFKFSETEGLRWIPFAKSRSKFVYHSDEGWSGLHDIPMGNRDHRVTLGFAFDDNDTLVEEYSGVRLRFETRRHRHRARRPPASRRRG